jgi:PmbA protein
MMDKLELAKWAASFAKKQGASQTKVRVSNSRDVEIEVRDKKLEKLKETTQNSLSLDIYLDKKYSGHYTNDLRKESLERFIQEAVAATKYLSADEFRELPDPKYYPKDMSKELNLFDKKHDELTTDKRIEIAKKLEKTAVSQSDKIISATGGFYDSKYSSATVLSNGFEGTSESTYFTLGAEVTAKDKDARPEDWAYKGHRFYDKLPTAEELGKEAATRALQKIGQKKIESGKFSMLVENRSASRLIGMLIGPMSARSLQQKNSYLEGMLGKKVASDKFTMIDDPFILGGSGSRLYDGDGIASQKRVMIEKGVLKNYYIDNYYGKKLGLEPTSGGTSNLVFGYGEKSLKELIKSIDKGILVTSFNGGNSNPTTGDFSFGIGGMLIEKGLLVHPVYEMNITGNAKDFWAQLAEMGGDVYENSSWRRSSMLFDDVYFAGL